MRRKDRGVPLGLVHRRNWARWGRYCICGLRWRRCPDRGWWVPVEEPPPPTPEPAGRAWRPADPRWNARTAAFWVGQSGLISRGQASRANRVRGRHAADAGRAA
ncbi:hypothetical protein [Micromonospora echinofusca]|uniref:Transposase of IS4/5 family n=1 Tax=Micromonospora echinofusca TaxID=47858 RepID=A0ABS3VT84_MICEH|nr:hypothetical protein [Micromonospora echinofusca]MBO4207752.1 hypothetical protein [Micromonospora echinofusca]